MCEESSEEGTMALANRTTFVQEELEALFKFIPSTKLLPFRQVSKELDEVAKIVLGKRRDIKLILTTDNFDSRFNWKFLKFLNNSPENVFSAPVMHIKNTNKPQLELEEGRICISFEVIQEICERLRNRGIIRKLIVEDGKNAPHFTSDYALTLLSHLPSLETLEISELDFPSVTSEQKQNSKFQLPSLKQIILRYPCDKKKEAKNLLIIILESSPNLEYITANNGYNDLNIISMLKGTERLSKIKELVLIKPEDLDTLLECKPKLVLHSFKIKSDGVVDPKKLFMLLRQQAINLKMLKFDGDCLLSESIFTLPLLPVLEKLIFKPWTSRTSGCLLSVNYGRHTPALKTLKISSEKSFDTWEEFLSYEISSERPPCPALEKLDLFIKGSTTQEMFDNWKNLFPNVKKLTIDDPEGFDFDQANKCWPNLEEVKLRIHTGYHKHDCEDIYLNEVVFGIRTTQDYWKKTGKIDRTVKEWWKEIPTPEINNTVASLKNLQKLEVIVKGWFGSFYFSDFAVYFGLRHMENLKELVITTRTLYDVGPEMMDISTDAFNFLVKNLPKLEKLNIREQKWERGENLK